MRGPTPFIHARNLDELIAELARLLGVSLPEGSTVTEDKTSMLV